MSGRVLAWARTATPSSAEEPRAPRSDQQQEARPRELRRSRIQRARLIVRTTPLRSRGDGSSRPRERATSPTIAAAASRMASGTGRLPERAIKRAVVRLPWVEEARHDCPLLAARHGRDTPIRSAATPERRPSGGTPRETASWPHGPRGRRGSPPRCGPAASGRCSSRRAGTCRSPARAGAWSARPEAARQSRRGTACPRRRR